MYNHSDMKVNLEPYAGKRICVAVSGGKDSMALLHYLNTHAKEFAIILSALNCEHGMRGESSERDSAFVAAYCRSNCIKLHSFKAEKGKLKSENDAREWRKGCYNAVLNEGKADLLATAHHLNDNAETVLFNLARGAALSGLTGIADDLNGGIIRPLISVARAEIDGYIEENAIPFVTDESNFSDNYTRNKIRRDVLPALEEAVPAAVGSIYRFSRLAAEDEEYFERQVGRVLVCRHGFGYLIKPCPERVIFRRAALKIVAKFYGRKDYTAGQLNRLFALQSAENGKKFGFLGLLAFKEEGGVAITEEPLNVRGEMRFKDELADGGVFEYGGNFACAVKALRFDTDKIPESAVIRFKKAGDRFTKFGGGAKSLSDYLTDKKVPQSMRGNLPLVCAGNEVLIVGGVEISDKIKIDEGTVRQGVFICADPFKLG